MAITMAFATAIVRRADRNLLSENGGPINITTYWIKSLLYRTGRKSLANVPQNTAVICRLSLIPLGSPRFLSLIPVWSQLNTSSGGTSSISTAVFMSRRNYSLTASKLATVIFIDILPLLFMKPPQLIYQGKTSACLPRHKFQSRATGILHAHQITGRMKRR